MPSSLMPFMALLVIIEENPVKGAKAAQKRNNGVRQLSYESSVSAGALYRALKKSAVSRSAFYSLPFWDGGYTKNVEHLNKHCHQFVYGAREGSEGARAEDHAYATQSYLDDDSKTLEDILAALERGGFDGLKKASGAQEQRNRLAQFAAKDRKQSSPADDETSDGSDSGRKATTDNGASKASGAAKLPYPKIPLKEVFNHLLVTLESEELGYFLAEQSKVGDRFDISVERDANDSKGMLVWRAIEITPLAVRD